MDAVRYNNKAHDHLEKLAQVVKGKGSSDWNKFDATCSVLASLITSVLVNTGLPELEKVVVIPFVQKEDEIDISHIPNRYSKNLLKWMEEFVQYIIEQHLLQLYSFC